jgi:hypothetical protein
MVWFKFFFFFYIYIFLILLFDIIKLETFLISGFSVFGSVVVVAFQIVFRVKIHANNFFYFLKIIFDISISK